MNEKIMLGKARCEQINCSNQSCPFISDNRVKFCLGIRHDDTLLKGLGRIQDALDDKTYNEILDILLTRKITVKETPKNE